MQHDLIQLAKITANQLRGGPRYKAMRGAVEAVTPNPILLGKITRNRVGCSRQRQCAEEGGIEDRNMRYVELSPRCLDARHCPWIVQRGKGNEVLDLVEHVIVDDGRVREVRPAMNDSMADSSEPNRVKINTSGRKLLLHGTHRRVMISNCATLLADPLDEALGLYLGGHGHHQLILQGRGAGVQHQDGRLAHHGPPVAVGWGGSACLMACAWIAVIATVF